MHPSIYFSTPFYSSSDRNEWKAIIINIKQLFHFHANIHFNPESSTKNLIRQTKDSSWETHRYAPASLIAYENMISRNLLKKQYFGFIDGANNRIKCIIDDIIFQDINDEDFSWFLLLAISANVQWRDTYPFWWNII